MERASLPAITIVTPCRNGERYIVEAIESVRRQHYPNVEHIVIDARSTDGTIELIKHYPEVTLISEPDEGSHDAMNRGVQVSHGDIIGFLNVDDVYPDGLLDDVARLFAAEPDLDIVVGDMTMFEDDQLGRRNILSERAHNRQNGLWLPELTFGVPGINGWFFRRRIFDRIGNFDDAFSFAADRHFLIRIALAGLTARLLGKPGIYYRRHPGSRTINRGMTNLMPIGHEHVRMALDLLKRPEATASDKRVFLAWNAFEGCKLILRHAMAGEFRDATGVLIEISRSNPLWPVRLLHALALRQRVRRLDRPPTKQRA